MRGVFEGDSEIERPRMSKVERSQHADAKILVTTAMVDAGVNVLTSFGLGLFGEAKEVVEDVLLASLQASDAFQDVELSAPQREQDSRWIYECMK